MFYQGYATPVMSDLQKTHLLCSGQYLKPEYEMDAQQQK